MLPVTKMASPKVVAFGMVNDTEFAGHGGVDVPTGKTVAVGVA